MRCYIAFKSHTVSMTGAVRAPYVNPCVKRTLGSAKLEVAHLLYYICDNPQRLFLMYVPVISFSSANLPLPEIRPTLRSLAQRLAQITEGPELMSSHCGVTQPSQTVSRTAQRSGFSRCWSPATHSSWQTHLNPRFPREVSKAPMQPSWCPISENRIRCRLRNPLHSNFLALRSNFSP